MKRIPLFWQFYCLAASVILFSSCSSSSNNSTKSYDYIAVQMSKGDDWSIIDKEGVEIVKEEYPADAVISPINDGVFWVKTNGKYQLFSLESPKKPVIDKEFTRVTTFESGVSVVSNPNEQICLINRDGKVLATLPKTVKKCFAFSKDGYALFVDNNDKCGILKKDGSIAVPANYAGISEVSTDGVAFAQKDKEGKDILVIDMQGKKLGSFSGEKYTLLSNYVSERKIIVKNANEENGCAIVLDITGKKLFEIKKAKPDLFCYPYIDGYMIFTDGDGKWGIVDDKGEVVIRAKYDRLEYLGDGEFSAKKGDKYGIINAKDESIIDFDFKDCFFKMGDNYLVKDESGFVLLDRSGKEIASFYDISNGGTNNYAEYVDIDALADNFVKIIGELEDLEPASSTAQKASLDIDNSHYDREIDIYKNLDDKLSATVMYLYNSYIAKEKTHIEKINDGWFTYERTVSDGWVWADILPYGIAGQWNLTDKSIDIEFFLDLVNEKLLATHTKLTNGAFSKIVNVAGIRHECVVLLSTSGNSVAMSIEIRK